VVVAGGGSPSWRGSPWERRRDVADDALRAAAETVSRAWDRLIEDDDSLDPMADAIGQLRAVLADDRSGVEVDRLRIEVERLEGVLESTRADRDMFARLAGERGAP
jgi:hypothetical protein